MAGSPPARKAAAKKAATASAAAGRAAAQTAARAGAKSAAKRTNNYVQERLAGLGLRHDIDFILHLPMRYEDETQLHAFGDLHDGMMAQVEGIVVDNEVQLRPRRQLVVQLMPCTEEAPGVLHQNDRLVLRFLNFYASQTRQLATGTRVRVRGEVRHGFFGMEMVHPRYSVVEGDTPLATSLTPVYPAGEGITQPMLRGAINRAFARADAGHTLEDTLPDAIRTHYRVAGFARSVRLLHFPPADVNQNALLERHHPAWARIKFDELLAQQLSLKLSRNARRDQPALALPARGEGLVSRFLARLPFSLTRAQQRVWHEISADMGAPYPMQRLLQGDVGSGKTVVAALAALQAIEHGVQAALMAPTEILAEQHFRKISEWVEALGVRTAWMTGSLKKKAKDAARTAIDSGEAQLVIGTHALIQDSVSFARLGLVIVDEQHRFGVDQRLALRNKGALGDGLGGKVVGTPLAHQLMMSATPIPRTLAMTYLADLDVSTIDELPPGRTPVTTRVIEQARRDEVIGRVHAAACEGHQVYWVCPLIEESEDAADMASPALDDAALAQPAKAEKLSHARREALQLQNAVETHAVLSAALPELTVGLVHGRLPPAEKAAVMSAFNAGTVHVLVATTVIEVGVDVPNASLMVIEHAERFGLSQLHQLRGRVGRGQAESACILLYQAPLSQTGRARLCIMRETNDGFAIARRDLELRGPGEFLGARQSGMAILRFADLQEDHPIVEQACEAADWMLRDYPDAVAKHLERWLRAREEYLGA